MKIIRYTDPEPIEITDFEKAENFEITLKENSDYICSKMGKKWKWSIFMKNVFQDFANKNTNCLSEKGETINHALDNFCKTYSLISVTLKDSKDVFKLPPLVHTKAIELND